MEYAIYLDWDKRFKSTDTLRQHIHSLIFKTYSIPFFKLNLKIKKVYWRLSSTKGTHIKIIADIDDVIFKEEDTFLILTLSLRALWEDDSHRIAIDLQRYARTMDLDKTNRIFSIKVLDGTPYYAGDWEIIYRGD